MQEILQGHHYDARNISSAVIMQEMFKGLHTARKTITRSS